MEKLNGNHYFSAFLVEHLLFFGNAVTQLQEVHQPFFGFGVLLGFF